MYENRIVDIISSRVNPVLAPYLPAGTHNQFFAVHIDGTEEEITEERYNELDNNAEYINGEWVYR